MNWQHFETAPKDGSEFLGWDGSDFRVCWWDRFVKGFTWGQRHEYSDSMTNPEEWYPTYWASLPQPPEPAGGGT